MKREPNETGRDGECPESGFGGFLRGLLAGIPWSERAEKNEVLSFAAASGNAVKLHNASGRTRVLGEDRDDIEVRAHKTARAESADAARELLDRIRIVGEEVTGSLELEVLTPRKWNRRGGVALEVAVPRSTRVEISAPNGKVHVVGVKGGVTVRSSNGSACVSDVVGDIDINTSNARIQCSCCAGHLIARSSNGKIELDHHKGSVDATTSNGLIRASVEEVGKLGVQLATSNGRIVLGLPEKVDAELDVWVDNGIIRNDRELESASRETRGRVLGRIGGGGALIKLRTSNGSIALR